MKRLKDIREGKIVKLPLVSTLHYFVRGKASNGRVHLECYRGDTHKRYTHLDRHLKASTKVELYNRAL